MLSFLRRAQSIGNRTIRTSPFYDSRSSSAFTFAGPQPSSFGADAFSPLSRWFHSQRELHQGFGSLTNSSASSKGISLPPSLFRLFKPKICSANGVMPRLPYKCITTIGGSEKSVSEVASASVSDIAPRIKFKRLDKTARHIMQILDKEAVEEVKAQREIPDIRPGYIIQLKLEVPENKRRVSLVKGIVIARRNAGLNTTIRLRRLVAGVGVESLLPLYSPTIKEIKVLDKKKVRRAKLYYLRDRMNPLKK